MIQIEKNMLVLEVVELIWLEAGYIRIGSYSIEIDCTLVFKSTVCCHN